MIRQDNFLQLTQIWKTRIDTIFTVIALVGRSTVQFITQKMKNKNLVLQGKLE